MSNVTLAASAGFCFGVKRAIEMAYAEIEKNNGAPLYSYGSLIHNKEVTKDLDAKGLHIIESLDGIDEGTVVIRSHGVGKFLYDALEEKGMRMVDGTCPFVKKIHTIVNEAWNQGKSIIIAGDGKHPEVQGTAVIKAVRADIHRRDLRQLAGIGLQHGAVGDLQQHSRCIYRYTYTCIYTILGRRGLALRCCFRICR